MSEKSDKAKRVDSELEGEEVNHIEFDEAMKQTLLEVYGGRDYQKPTQNRIFRIVKEMTQAQFIHAMDELTAKSRRAPGPEEIRKGCSGFIESAKQRVRAETMRRLSQGEPCRHCQNHGLVQAISRHDPSKEFAFRCHCGVAETLGLSYAIPKWDGDVLDNFIPFETGDEWLRTKQIQREAIQKKMSSGRSAANR